MEYRQAQTALSAYFIQQENNFSLAYPTPVLGKPWSIPMEFPLYQWTVVGTSNLTGLGLTKAGRLVSLVCFYLSLPAVFLLPGRWGVAWGRRWLVLAVVASCPLYIFYGRSFLIETMALMFALWFWVAFERAVAGRHRGWLAVAIFAGTGAGLAKVTTFMLYLLPAGAWALCRLRSGWREGRWRGELAWMAAAVTLPFAATWWWVWKADRIKALNPLADFLGSDRLRDFNFGTLATHLSPELWALKLRIIREELTALPMLGAVALLLVLGARGRWREALQGCLVFVAALLLFPVLYSYHDYYYVANTVALLLAVGMVLVGLAEQPRLRWAALSATFAVIVAQASYYLQHYYPTQCGISEGGSTLTTLLRHVTRPDEVVVITGEDWNSMTAYYARRRALMLRDDPAANPERVDQALRALGSDRIGALVVTGSWHDQAALVRRLAAAGLAAEPWCHWQDKWVFLRRDLLPELPALFRRTAFDKVEWKEGLVSPEPPLGGAWHEVSQLSVIRQSLFMTMHPTPVRFFSTYNPALDQDKPVREYGAHPEMRLVFHLKSGKHLLRTVLYFRSGAYDVPPGVEPTDGVEVTLSELRANGTRRQLHTRLLDPVKRPGDRGPFPLRIPFNLEADGEVELYFGPGPNGSSNRDWVWIRGPLVIE